MIDKFDFLGAISLKKLYPAHSSLTDCNYSIVKSNIQKKIKSPKKLFFY